MNGLTFTDNNGTTWERVQKQTARKKYNNGETLVIIAANMRPFTSWHCESLINKDANETPFDTLCNAYELYNCINSETGKRAAFYAIAD